MEQSKKSEITRNKILASAEREFSQKGFAAARVDEIAENAGVNKRMVYAHFASKEGLYKSVLSIVYARRAEYEKEIEIMEFDSSDSIRRAITMYFDFLIKNESFVRLILWENLEYARFFEAEKGMLLGGIEILLEKGKEKGFIRPDLDIKQTALSCNTFCFSTFSNIHTLSKLLGEDLTEQEQLNKRKEHVADVLVSYIMN